MEIVGGGHLGGIYLDNVGGLRRHQGGGALDDKRLMSGTRGHEEGEKKMEGLTLTLVRVRGVKLNALETQLLSKIEVYVGITNLLI